MRRAFFPAVLAALVVAPALGVAEAPSNPPIVTPAPAQTPTPDQTPAPPDAGQPQEQRLLTPEQLGRDGVVKGVVEQPFRDFNMMRSKIPPVLLEAMADAYERPSPGTCPGIIFQIKRLDEALGPDLDEPVSTEHPSLLTRGGGQARDAGLDAMRTGVQSQIPFDGVIRFVSGADHHDRQVMAAIQAGAIRRGYLKGLGEARGCMPPALPRHLAHPVNVASSDPPK
jgi:hypothetical protein